MTKPQILFLAFAAGPPTNERIALAKLVCFILAFCIAASIPTSAQTFAKLANFAATDGNLYGTTQFGGSGSVRCYPYGCGSVFEITTAGTLTILRRLLPADGAWPG